MKAILLLSLLSLMSIGCKEETGTKTGKLDTSAYEARISALTVENEELKSENDELQSSLSSFDARLSQLETANNNLNVVNRAELLPCAPWQKLFFDSAVDAFGCVDITIEKTQVNSLQNDLNNIGLGLNQKASKIELSNLQSQILSFNSSLKAVAKTGSYNDLIDKPAIPKFEVKEIGASRIKKGIYYIDPTPHSSVDLSQLLADENTTPGLYTFFYCVIDVTVVNNSGDFHIERYAAWFSRDDDTDTLILKRGGSANVISDLTPTAPGSLANTVLTFPLLDNTQHKSAYLECTISKKD